MKRISIVLISLVLLTVIPQLEGEPTRGDTILKGYILAEEYPLEGVNVTITNGETNWTYTHLLGMYEFGNLSAGDYVVTFSKQWVETEVRYITVVPGNTHYINLSMNLLNLCSLNGTITVNDREDPAPGAEVSLEVNNETYNITADGNGFFDLEDIPAGSGNITASLEGYQIARQDIILTERTHNRVRIDLKDIPPLEVSIDPVDGTTNLSVFRSIVLNFTRAVDRSSITRTSMILRDLSTHDPVSVGFGFFENDTVVMMLPETLLDYMTYYRIEITTSVRDTMGIPLSANASSDFSTEWETIVISIFSSSPARNEISVPVDTRIQIVFPEPMVSHTLDEDSAQLRVSDGDGTRIEGTFVYYPANHTAEFIPSRDLEYNTGYVLWLSSEIEPEAPTHDFRGATISFETEISMTTGSISGRIIDQEGFPFPPEIVEIKLTVDDTILSYRLTQNGGFQITGLEEGLYILDVIIQGEKEYSATFQVVAGDHLDLETIEIGNDIGPYDQEEESRAVLTISVLIAIIVGGACLFLIFFVVIIIIIIRLVTKKKKKKGPEE